VLIDFQYLGIYNKINWNLIYFAIVINCKVENLYSVWGGILVICEKCAGKVDDNGRCSLCGYDNSNVQIPKNYEVKPKSFRSTRVTVFMCWAYLEITGCQRVQ